MTLFHRLLGMKKGNAASVASRSRSDDDHDVIDVQTMDRSVNRIGELGQLVDMDVSFDGHWIAIAMSNQLQIYSVETTRKQSVYTPEKLAVRSLAFDTGSCTLLAVYQSRERRHEWYAEVYKVTHGVDAPTAVCSAFLDVDPDDRVENIRLHSTLGGQVVYELRQCGRGVSKIWKAVPAKMKMKTKLRASDLPDGIFKIQFAKRDRESERKGVFSFRLGRD